MQAKRRVHQGHRNCAILALALLVFAQISLAASGCFSTRTGTLDPDSEGCATVRLLCWTHCQADEQTHDPSSVPMLDADQFVPLAAPALEEPIVPLLWRRARLGAPPATPPPTILFGRMLN